MSLIFAESEKSNKNHAISAYNLFGTDNSVPNELISVPRLIGSRTVFLSDFANQFIWYGDLLMDKLC